MFSPQHMKPKVTTGFFQRARNNRISPVYPETTPPPAIQHQQKRATFASNLHPQNDELTHLSTLLRQAQAALGQTDSNGALCEQLARAADAADADVNKNSGATITHRTKRSTFIRSLAHFDDDLTNFFLYNYSDHHGDHDALHKILSTQIFSKNCAPVTAAGDDEHSGHHHRHASVATMHITDEASSHKLTSAKILGLLVSWEFNIFELYEMVGPNTFVIVGDGIIQHLHSLISDLQFDHERFLTLLQQLGESYLDNPYHNQLHGADVAQALNWTLTIGGAASAFTPIDQANSGGNGGGGGGDDNGSTTLASNILNNNRVPKITMLASILAALAHDAAHPGVNNNYLVAISDPLALTYNDHSPLEHMHAATFFRLLQKEECRFIPNDFKEKSRAMRGVIVNMILSTDMMKHGSLIGTLKNRLSNGGQTLTDDGRDIQMVLNICLHLADISNPARETNIAVPWAQRIQEEFWRQGDLTLAYDPQATIAPMNDRQHAAQNITHASNLQIGFTLGLVKPLFELVNTIDGVNLNEPLSFINSNLETYKSLKEQNLEMTMSNIEKIQQYQIE
jgi:hypothetical protein